MKRKVPTLASLVSALALSVTAVAPVRAADAPAPKAEEKTNPCAGGAKRRTASNPCSANPCAGSSRRKRDGAENPCAGTKK
jgi:uncharacterized membrane protein